MQAKSLPPLVESCRLHGPPEGMARIRMHTLTELGPLWSELADSVTGGHEINAKGVTLSSSPSFCSWRRSGARIRAWTRLTGLTKMTSP
jgi:hypothetical protein